MELKESKWEESQKKKDYLNGYLKSKKEEQLILDQIQRLREDEMFPSIQYDDMPHGTDMRDLSEYVSRLYELFDMLKIERLEGIKKYDEIRGKIKMIDDDRFKELLTRRYLIGEKWEHICEKMDYSWKWVHKIHGKALENFKF